MDYKNSVLRSVITKAVAALTVSSLALPLAADARPQKRMSAEEAQFRSWLIQHLKNEYRDDDDLQNLVYGYALVDLNGDGRNEAIAWATGYRCGTSGCDPEIFVRGRSGWRLFSGGPGTRLPIKLLATRSHGWRDLAGWQAGGGIKRPYEARWRFNGREYEIVYPADWTGVKPRPPRLRGRILIKGATIPLFPSKCRRITEAPSVFGPLPTKTGKPGSC
jgi:hypothetical protein